MIALLGKKMGMSQIFDEARNLIPVTVVEVGPCPILEITTRANGVKAFKIGYEPVKERNVGRPQLSFFKKIGVSPLRHVREFPFVAQGEFKVGDILKADLFHEGDFVDITGRSIGKGFQGGMKRWHWGGGPRTHGSTSHRRVGSMGSTTTPGRVWKGHHLPGHMGHATVTVQNLSVIKVNPEENLLLVRGAVPGPKRGLLVIRSAKKAKKKSMAVKPQASAKTEDK
jgi:large subunit ribosomal protein L3